MPLQIKIAILFFLIIFGLLLNYEEKNGSFLKIFPQVKNPSLAYISFSKNQKGNFFQTERIWGWPFAYWQKNQFNFKSLFFNLIFYLIVWLIFLFIFWLIKGIKKLQERRLKPPPIKF